MKQPELSGDYHVHSTYSDDATSTIAENVAAAHAAGLTELRLIDHVRKSTTWIPDFVAEVARTPVPTGLTVLTGVETKLLDAFGALDLPADLAGVDAIVIADHQFPGTDGPWTPDAARQRMTDGLSSAEILDLLIGALGMAMKAVAAGPATGQLAHCFSILPKIGLSEDDLSDAQLADWADSAARTGTLIEVNEKWGCPGPRAVRAAIAAGARLVAASDAHVATEVGRYDRVATILAEARA